MSDRDAARPSFPLLAEWLLLTKQIDVVADILMGAAHADGSVHEAEARTVRELLEEAVGAEHLPGHLIDRLLTFDPRRFDLDAACHSLRLAGESERRHVLELVAAICDADDIHDLSESASVSRVAKGIGAAPGEYEDLVVSEVEFD